MSIRSRSIKRGDPKESTWPSDYGTGDRTPKIYKAKEEESKAAYIIDDTMPLTKSPLSRTQYFDSKRALRKHYREHGVEEVGNEYERGYDPGAEREKERERKLDQKIKQNLIDRLYHGKR